MTPHASIRPALSRRSLLSLGAALSVTLMGGPQAFADPVQARRKLVVVVCRGAMDGLSVAPPRNDPDYAGLRGSITISPDDALRLDADFGLHPKLRTLHALAQSGQARIAPAVAIPQRIRSHFEAQDLLETGGGSLHDATTGWLNRALSATGPRRPIRALSIGPQAPMILAGTTPAESWSPGGHTDAVTTRLAATLQQLYGPHPELAAALAAGLATEAETQALHASGRGPQHIAETAGKLLSAPDGPSIAVLSLAGFDTHAAQGAVEGQLAVRLNDLDQTLAGLQIGLGDEWGNTMIIAATEFGRTARINGTGGTDHGTASTLILAGGAVKPGRIVGDWPTLASAKLFEARDLAPTLDIRSVFKGILADHLGIERTALDRTVFPASHDAPPISNLVRL